jgi:hypothetical protein
VIHPFPERLQCFTPLSITNEDDGASLKIKDNGQVFMPFLYRNLINGNPTDIFTDWDGKTSFSDIVSEYL